MMKLLSLTPIIALLVSTPASAAEYNVDRSQENLVRFISDAPLEDFDGVTDQIDGYVYWDGEELPEDESRLASSELHLEVKLETLDTGIGLRNRHMRDNYLETDEFPFAVYAARLTGFEKLSDTLYSAIAEGMMKIHGVERPIQVTTTLIPYNEGFRVSCDFEVNLKDYRIKIPKFMFLKIDEIIRLELNFYLKRVAEKD
jgi:polyisoprenoid-binding protein YceI